MVKFKNMITIVHGNDITTSRKFFLDQKDENSLTFDAESLVLDELEHSLQGFGLFGERKKIFIENLFSRKATKNLEPIGSLLSKNQGLNVYVWADKEVGVKSLLSYPRFENKNFKIPNTIWSFLDGIRPNNLSNVKSFHSAINSTEPEIVFAMIVRQFRLLLGLTESSENTIDEVKRLAPWQKSKLMRQASLFDKDSLKQIYKKLYKIEKQQKTGSSNLSLVQNIDILLLQI